MRAEEPTRRSKFAELIEAAEAEPDQWFAEDYKDKINAAATIYTHFGRKLAEVRQRGDTIYLRVK